MLRWRLPDDPDEAHSPLLLVPVALERPSPREPFRLRKRDGDLVLNPALAVKLQVEFGLTLPTLDDTDEADLVTVLESVRNACRQRPGWEIEERAVSRPSPSRRRPCTATSWTTRTWSWDTRS
jgi:hypothetical protein